MSENSLNDPLYMGVTPGGSFYAVQDEYDEFGRDFLKRLLSADETPAFDLDMAQNLAGLNDHSETGEFIHLLQDAGFIYGQQERSPAPIGSVESLLPDLLKMLSDEGRAVLAEGQGLLAALSASLSAIYKRHRDVLRGNLGYRQRAWGLIDAGGNSEIGFWPLYVGDDRFTLIVGGMPQFNQPAFTRLIWALERRYGRHGPAVLN